MSFLSSIYSKLGLSPSRPKRAEHSGETPDQYGHFMEEIDPEFDGFVLLTDSKSKRCKTIGHEFHQKIEHIGVQQATSCPGLLPYARQGLVTRGKPSDQQDFVTASDLPFQLSRPLQVLFKMSLTKTEFQSALNIKQYDYDFSLERTVLGLYDD